MFETWLDRPEQPGLCGSAILRLSFAVRPLSRISSATVLTCASMLTVIALGLLPADAVANEPLTRNTEAHFASVEEGQAVVRTRDTYLKALTRFDRQVRLQTDGNAPESELIEFTCQQVLPWDEDLQRSVVEAIERLRPKLEPFDLPLPNPVVLIQMSGKDESNAAYTRGSAIFLPLAKLRNARPDALDRLVLHELFHVLSRNAPELRRDLYRIVGFEVCDPIPLPAPLADLKLTNPDAPLIDCRIHLTEENGAFDAAPILFSSSATYDTMTKPSLFKYLTFRLMKIEEHDGAWRPVLKDGEPVLIPHSELKSFAEQIGKNTGYVIHPDEILADNFFHMVLQTQSLASPQIVERMRDRLKRANLVNKE